MRPRDFAKYARLPAYYRDFFAYRRQAARLGAMVPGFRRRRAILDEATADTPFDAQYIYHTAWAARVLRRTAPERHTDIGSSLYFAAIASAIVPIDFYDYRPPDLHLDNVTVGHADLLNLPFPDRSLASLSCMHVVEHVGLGRYGDPLDAAGDRKAMRELARVVAAGGRLLFVVPMGRPRVVFNAHRIYGFDMIRDQFADLALEEFALITDGTFDHRFISDADPAMVEKLKYGCGCLLLRRPG